jgi:hypothetical protein
VQFKIAAQEHSLLNRRQHRDVFDANFSWSVQDVRNISAAVRDLNGLSARQLVKTHFGLWWVVEFLGQSSNSTLFTPEAFFKRSLDSKRLYRQDWLLVGRSSEMHRFEEFLNDDTQAVAILPGRGTIGKTRLLRQFSEQCFDHSLIWSPWFIIVSLDLNDLTMLDLENIVLFLDDAHKSHQLDESVVDYSKEMANTSSS